MKKLIVLLIILLGFSLIAFALGAQKLVFVPDGNNPVDTIHENINGFVIINETPDGATVTTIQIQIRDAAPELEYTVKSGSVVLGTFVTNKAGQGKLHCNLSLVNPELGGAINIWYDGTRYFRAMIP